MYVDILQKFPSYNLIWLIYEPDFTTDVTLPVVAHNTNLDTGALPPCMVDPNDGLWPPSIYPQEIFRAHISSKVKDAFDIGESIICVIHFFVPRPRNV